MSSIVFEIIAKSKLFCSCMINDDYDNLWFTTQQ